MNRLIILVALFFATNCAIGQNTNSISQLFSNEERTTTFGWFIQPELRYFLNHEDMHPSSSFLTGGKLGTIINKSWYLGFGGFAKTSKLKYNANDRSIGIGYGYGGVYIAKSFMTDAIVHPAIGVNIGYGGSAQYVYINDTKGANRVIGFTYFEPTASIEINTSKWTRLGIGVTYRYLQPNESTLLPEELLNGWSINTSLLFGKL